MLMEYTSLLINQATYQDLAVLSEIIIWILYMLRGYDKNYFLEYISRKENLSWCSYYMPESLSDF